LLIGGAHPYADRSWDAFRQVDGTDPEAFIAALEAVVEQRAPPELKPRVLANDLQALAAAAQERPALEDVLPTMAMPCLLLVGEADAQYPAVQECAKHMAHATLISLPGLNHAAGFMRSDLVLPHVTKFLATVRT
jgi:pimeloyl-ACP methyl ester carboxylesterase